MKRSDADAAVLIALRAVVGDVVFTAADVTGMCAGLAGKQYPGLNKALEMARVRQSAKGLGHCLKRLQGMVFDDWRLCARRNRVTDHWVYRFANVSNLTQEEIDLLDAEEFEERMSKARLSTQSREIEKQLEKIDAKEDDARAQAQVDEMSASLQALNRAAAEHAAQTAGKVDEWDSLDGVRLYTKYRRPREEIEGIIAVINRPEKGIHARTYSVSDSGTGVIAILLTGPWLQRKARWQQLEALFHNKGWTSPYEGAFDGVTAELKHGAAIPATASKDPRHYDTAKMTEQIANSLAEQGISSLDMPLDEAVLRNRSWQQWNIPRGDPILNPHHSHVGAPIPMSGAKFDPVGEPNPNRWTQKL